MCVNKLLIKIIDKGLPDIDHETPAVVKKRYILL
jgi:hypothetical protein